MTSSTAITQVTRVDCQLCGKEVATPERWNDFSQFYEAERSIDHFEFAPPPEPPFCTCDDGEENDGEWEERTEPSVPFLPAVEIDKPPTLVVERSDEFLALVLTVSGDPGVPSARRMELIAEIADAWRKAGRSFSPDGL